MTIQSNPKTVIQTDQDNLIPVLSTQDISYHVDSVSAHKTILNKLSFSLKKGSINTLIGENGAGKSSLFKIISGDITNYSGTLSFYGQPLKKSPSSSNIGFPRSIAILPQFSVLNFPFTCREIVTLGRTPHSTGSTIDQDIVNQCLLVVDMQNFAEQNYMLLSGGEKQRIQIARVLAQVWREEDSKFPRLLLLDEPCNALDLSHQIAFMETLCTLSSTGLTVLMVLHDISLAARYSDYIIALKQGSTAFQGTPKNVLTEQSIEELLNVDGRLLKDENNTILGWIPK